MKTRTLSVWLGLALLFLGVGLQVQAQTWSFTGGMQQARIYPTATLLTNEQVLVVGGYQWGRRRHRHGRVVQPGDRCLQHHR